MTNPRGMDNKTIITSVETVEVIKVTSITKTDANEDTCIENIQYWTRDGRLISESGTIAENPYRR